MNSKGLRNPGRWVVRNPDAPAAPQAPSDGRIDWYKHKLEWHETSFTWSRMPFLLTVFAGVMSSYIVVYGVGIESVGARFEYVGVAVVLALGLGFGVRRGQLTWSRRRVRKALERERAWQAWNRANFVRHASFGRCAEQASALVTVWQRLVITRAFREEWITVEDQRTMHRKLWSLLTRLRASEDQRADLAELATLDREQHRVLEPHISSELAELDTEASETAEAWQTLLEHAQQLDQILTETESAEVDSARTTALVERLGGSSNEAGIPSVAGISARVLADDVSGDARILSAQLHAVSQHLAA